MGSLLSNYYNISIDFILFKDKNKPFLKNHLIFEEPIIRLGTFNCVKDKKIIINQGIRINDGEVYRLIKYVYKNNVLTYYFDNHIILTFYKNTLLERDNKNTHDFKFHIVDPCQSINFYYSFNKKDNIYYKKINNSSNELDIIYTFLYES